MYYPILLRRATGHPSVRGVPVEFKVCTCGAEYQGEQCHLCGTPFAPDRMRRVVHDWIIESRSPAYERRPRLRCDNRAKHYRLLVGEKSAKKLGETWQNLFEVPDEFATLLKVRSLQELVKTQGTENLQESPYIRELVGSPAPQRFAEVLKSKLEAEKERLDRIIFEETRCPICKGRPNRPESHVWVWTGRRVDADPHDVFGEVAGPAEEDDDE